MAVFNASPEPLTEGTVVYSPFLLQIYTFGKWLPSPLKATASTYTMCKQDTASTYTMCKQATPSTYTMCKQGLPWQKRALRVFCEESACLHIVYVDAVSCLHIVYVDATTCLHIVQVICCLVITWFCVNLPQLLQHQLRKFWACECLKTPNWCEWRFQTLRMGAKGDCGPCPQ